MTRRIALLLLLAAASCGAPAVEHPELGFDVPEAWTAGTAPKGTVPAAWWTSFGDSRLTTLVGEALERNSNLQAAAARVARAAAQARIAGADLYPMVSGGGSARRGRQVFVGFPIPGEEVLSTTSTTFGLSLDLSWEVDLWGRLRAKESAALADVQAAQADFAGARLSLVAQTAKIYFAVLEAREQVRLARATVESNRSTTERIRERYQMGLRPALDMRLTEANLSASEATLRMNQERLDATLRQFEILLGRYPSAELAPEGKLPAVPGPVPAGLPSELLERRPDIVAAERRLAAAHERETEAFASLFPRLSLTAAGGTTSEELSDLVDWDYRVWNLAANLLQPIFQGGRLLAAVDLAEAGAKEALARYTDAALRAFGEVETALAAERLLAEREAALVKAVEHSRAASEIAERRYNEGLSNIVALLEVQRRLTSVESMLQNVRRARLEARVNLHLALGGGFEEAKESK